MNRLPLIEERSFYRMLPRSLRDAFVNVLALEFVGVTNAAFRCG